MKYFFLVLMSGSVLANVGETLGPSPTAMGLGTQSSLRSSDSSNAYAIPAALAHGTRALLDISSVYIETHLDEMGPITTQNTATRTNNTMGRVDPNPKTMRIAMIHASLPIVKESGPKLTASIFVPWTNLQSTDTGSAYGPNYVMLRSRLTRPQAFVSLAVPFTPSWALSVGFYTGEQVSGATNMSMGANGGPKSSGQLQLEAKPSIAGTASLIYARPTQRFFLGFQQEQKSNMNLSIQGDAANPLPVLYDFSIQSLLYYDPMIVRSGLSLSHDRGQLVASLDYQNWKHYRAPTLSYEQHTGIVVSSANYETIRTRDIVIPKLGVEYLATDRLPLRAGVAYRPSPLKGDFSGAGNSIDTDTTIFGVGAGYHWSSLDVSSALQYHALKKKTVNKSPGQEDGTSGTKVGGPTYTIAGHVWAMSLGLQYTF